MTKSKASTRTPNNPTPRRLRGTNVVLAIDPGIERLGIAVLERSEGKEKLLHSECFRTKSKLARGERLRLVGEKIAEIVSSWKPSALAIETLFFNQNITSGIGVAEARGVVLYEASRGGLEICEYGPQAVKIAVTGYGAANKKQVEMMVCRLLGIGKSRKMLDDELDAIALGITHLASKKDICYK